MIAAAWICSFLVNALWQSTLLVFLAWGVLRVFRRTNAATRYAVWLGVLAASLALPLLASTGAVPRAPDLLPAFERVMPARLAPSARPVSTAASPQRPPAAVFARTRFAVPDWIAEAVAWGWLAIAAALLSRLAISLWHIEGLKRDALPLPPRRRARLASWTAENRAARDARLCISARAPVPIAIGLFDAMILIPTDVERELEGADLDRIVLHELAHLRRRDDWTNAFAQVVKSLLFFSPAVAFAVAQLDFEREVACDDSVLRCSTEALTYANTLARMTDIVAWPHRPIAAPGIFMTRRGMSMRIERILEEGRDVRGRLALGPAALALCAVAVIALSASIAPSIALSHPEDFSMHATPIGDAPAAEIVYTGTWELRNTASGLQFDFHYPPGLSNVSERADLDALGISKERLAAPRSTIAFAVDRDAGVFDCAGEAGAGVGHGDFRFQPNAAYAAEFERLGMKLSLRDRVVAGMFGVSLDYVRGLAALGLTPMSFQTLVGLKMLGGSLETIRALRRDFPDADAHALTAFVMMQRRMPEAHLLHTIFPGATIGDVTTMAMAGVTPEYVAALQRAAVRGLSANNVTALRSSGVDTAFVERMIRSGKTGLTVDDVVALEKGGF